MVTYLPPPPCVSTRIGTAVAVAAADGAAEGAGEADPPAAAWGAHPAAASTTAASELAERIGPYYGEGERNDLEAERKEQAQRVDRGVAEQGRQRRREPQRQHPLGRRRTPRGAQHAEKHDRERNGQGHDGHDTALGCEGNRKRMRIEGDRRPGPRGVGRPHLVVDARKRERPDAQQRKPLEGGEPGAPRDRARFAVARVVVLRAGLTTFERFPLL